MPVVVLPSENQQREFDAKLLIACALAERGVTTYIGARHEIHARLHQLPRGVYAAKDFAPQSGRVFEILERLGSRITAWDEEGLLAFDPEVYYRRRVSPRTVPRVAAFFAWGEINRDLIERAPGFPGTPIHVTGNARIDLLRPELRAFHEPAVAELRRRYGSFVLFNANFGVVNSLARIPINDPRKAVQQHPDVLRFFDQRRQAFGIFQAAIPQLAQRFPAVRIVVRPHPSESPEPWKRLAAQNANVDVVLEGPVIPWLLAARVMLHNSCTTGLESFLMGKPAIALMTPGTTTTGSGLSNAVSVQVEDVDAAGDAIAARLTRDEPFERSAAQRELMDRHVAATTGPLAADRIADVLAALARDVDEADPPAWGARAGGVASSAWRRLRKGVTGLIPGHKTGSAHNRHRYPGLTPGEVDARIARLGATLRRFAGVRRRRVTGQIDRIDPEVA